MRYRYPTENSPFLDSSFRRNDGYAEVSPIENLGSELKYFLSKC